MTACTCGTEAAPDEHASWGTCGWCHARLMREVAAERHDEWWGEVPA